MEMPKLTAEHEKLALLAGTWKGTETMHPSQWAPDGMTAEAVTTSRVGLTGFVVITDYEQRVGGQATFVGHGVYTIDPKQGGVLLYWFDSMGGTCEEFRGNWQGDVLTLTSDTSPMGHMRLTYDFSQAGKLASAMDTSPDGQQWSRMFDGVYSKES
ncbi:MAG: DUF1579 family protein [Planctomycetes bacterium]|nr:DUF1579 family protein [Planctomycetota bacterium]